GAGARKLEKWRIWHGFFRSWLIWPTETVTSAESSTIDARWVISLRRCVATNKGDTPCAWQ
ncbi:MAG: hypothetical protein ABL877_13275, partial [Thiobacillus sp.]